jgi:hypothetical protein
MAIATYSELQRVLDRFVADQRIPIERSPHGAFWRITYMEFVTSNVPNVLPDTRICIPGRPSESGVYLALAGLPPFDDTTFPRMPPVEPFFSREDIKAVEQWIANGCHE